MALPFNWKRTRLKSNNASAVTYQTAATHDLLDRLTTRIDDIERNLIRVISERTVTEAQLVRAQLVELATGMAAEAQLGRAHADELAGKLQLLVRAVYDEEPFARRQLHALRRTSDYLLAFEEETPLVSVVFPTYSRPRILVDRALHSILSQTYPNIEVIVVGDGAGHDTREAIEALGDHRVRYENRSMNGPYPQDTRGNWLSAGSIPLNESISMATGRWIAPFADDDAMRPTHIERNVENARANRFEVSYGRFESHERDGTTPVEGQFPPTYSHFAWQTGIFHAGLRFMGIETNSALFDEPNDWSLARRMMAIGVRFGHVPEVLTDYYPSYRWDESHQPSSPDE